MVSYKKHISVRIFCLLLSVMLLQQGDVLSTIATEVQSVDLYKASDNLPDPLNSHSNEEPCESENTRESEHKEDKHLTTASWFMTTALLQYHVITDDEASPIVFCKVTTPPPRLS